MNVTLLRYKDLPSKEREKQPNNGSGREDARYLKVEAPGQETMYYSDAMEPEDATFARDLKWIKPALLAAYEAGRATS